MADARCGHGHDFAGLNAVKMLFWSAVVNGHRLWSWQCC